MADYKTSLSLIGAYRLDEALLSDIFQVAKTFVEDGDGAVTISVEFGETHTLESTRLEEILADSLLRAHVITRISMDGRSSLRTDPPRRFSFTARSSDLVATTIQIDLAGAQANCRSAISHIEEQLAAKRQWYSPLVSLRKPTSAIVVSSCFILALLVPVGLGALISVRAAEIVGVSELILMVPLIGLLGWLRSLMFPTLIVEIGRSAEIDVRARSLRGFIFVVVVVGLIVAILGGVIATRLIS